jgi:hypothetical protein
LQRRAALGLLELDRIITRCLHKDAVRRFLTADDLKIALLELKEELDSQPCEREKANIEAASFASRNIVPWAEALGLSVIAQT